MVCCDTSFLFSLYGRDVHTPRALALVARLGEPIAVTSLNEFELRNAVRFAVFRRALPSRAAGEILGAFDADLNAGRLEARPADLESVVVEANRLSQARTEEGGHRAFDILQVVAAAQLSAALFLTFDANQGALARFAGLVVLP
jgi:predicted nucleic acid-binding protein